MSACNRFQLENTTQVVEINLQEISADMLGAEL